MAKPTLPCVKQLQSAVYPLLQAGDMAMAISVSMALRIGIGIGGWISPYLNIVNNLSILMSLFRSTIEWNNRNPSAWRNRHTHEGDGDRHGVGDGCKFPSITQLPRQRNEQPEGEKVDTPTAERVQGEPSSFTDEGLDRAIPIPIPIPIPFAHIYRYF